MSEKIIVTGACGFIGFHLVSTLLSNGFEVLGIDNINNYYDPKLKKSRLNRLREKYNFKFQNSDISDKKSIEPIFNSFCPNKVVNLAAQAGVRYSLSHPHKYIESNIVGFMNILELSRENNIEGLIYASSSSVYGNNKSIPFNENDMINQPISIYAATKAANELMAYSYSHLYDLNTTGLRFFTVYGPWGRPDMAYFKFADKIYKNEPIKVFNNGEMKRDFTYINDIVSGILSSINKNYKCETFNLGNNKSIDLMYFIKEIEDQIGKKANIEYLPMQSGDVKETYANIDKSKKMLNYNPSTSIERGLFEFIRWYKQYYNY
tara:strand:- start:158 stop:1117 length:960 start_codon:yes stop_codon:yes gene_type:complete